jgi:hypothetical protein
MRMAGPGRKKHMATKKRTQLKRPKNLQEAFDQGWKIVEDLSSWKIGESIKREGFLIFKKPGCGDERLEIPFVALYDVSRPHFFLRDAR